MKVFILIGLWMIMSCGTYTIKSTYEPKIYTPIVDSSGEEHNYKTNESLQLNNDYALYCMKHHRWEVISVRYTPTYMSKLRREEFGVRCRSKNS